MCRRISLLHKSEDVKKKNAAGRISFSRATVSDNSLCVALPRRSDPPARVQSTNLPPDYPAEARSPALTDMKYGQRGSSGQLSSEPRGAEQRRSLGAMKVQRGDQVATRSAHFDTAGQPAPKTASGYSRIVPGRVAAIRLSAITRTTQQLSIPRMLSGQIGEVEGDGDERAASIAIPNGSATWNASWTQTARIQRCCRPPTRGMAVTWPGLRGSTFRGIGAAGSGERCAREPINAPPVARRSASRNPGYRP
jgi:hypothetical protein